MDAFFSRKTKKSSERRIAVSNEEAKKAERYSSMEQSVISGARRAPYGVEQLVCGTGK